MLPTTPDGQVTASGFSPGGSRPGPMLPPAPPEPRVISTVVKAGLVIVTLATAGGALINLVTPLRPSARAVTNPFPARPSGGSPGLPAVYGSGGPPASSPAPLAGGLRLEEPGARGAVTGGGGRAGEDAGSGLGSRQARFGDYGGVVVERQR